MSAYFVDSSALVKRYVSEVGSKWMQTQMQPQSGNLFVVAELTSIEFTSMIARRHREGNITLFEREKLIKDCLLHLKNDYVLVRQSQTVLKNARLLLIRYPLRALDAIQLASAQVSEHRLGVKPTFIAADQRLLTAATAEGFIVDDPNAHP